MPNQCCIYVLNSQGVGLRELSDMVSVFDVQAMIYRLERMAGTAAYAELDGFELHSRRVRLEK